VEGLLAGQPVLLLPVGMGKTNAAQGLTALLETHSVQGVIGFGVGGAYPGSGLETGDLALATREIYGDEGVAAPDSWLSTREIGIPLVERDGARVFNVFDLDEGRVARAGESLRRAGLAATAGPFVTVSACSGTLARGAELAERFGAVCESMEGAAYAHVAALYDVPFLEVRGISNLVENRDLSRWRLHDAAEAAARAVEAVAAELR
jgi:futalosine hydrolase